jgi:hypothetical protein
MDNIELFFTVALMGFSLILFVISAITWSRVRSTKLLLVSAAFGIFFVKGLVLTLGLFVDEIYSVFHSTVLLTVIDFGILAFLYLGVAKR